MAIVSPALELIGEIGGDEAVRALQGFITSVKYEEIMNAPGHLLAERAIEELIKMNLPNLIKIFSSALDNAEWARREWLAKTMIRAVERRKIKMEKSDMNRLWAESDLQVALGYHDYAVEYISKYGEAALPALLGTLKHAPFDKKVEAAKLLLKLAPAQSDSEKDKWLAYVLVGQGKYEDALAFGVSALPAFLAVIDENPSVIEKIKPLLLNNETELGKKLNNYLQEHDKTNESKTGDEIIDRIMEEEDERWKKWP
jgi:hypothetical protein